MDIKTYMQTVGRQARSASRSVAAASTDAKNKALLAMAAEIRARAAQLLEANQRDLDEARANGLEAAMIDRLTLSAKGIEAMAVGLEQVAALPDPVGEMGELKRRPSGITVGKMRVPLGVIGIIYEARPNVTADAAGLCLKAGNAVLLRGGSEAIRSNTAISSLLMKAAYKAGIPEGALQFVEFTDREAVDAMTHMTGLLDVIIPRGGAGLIHHIVENSSVPVIETGTGVCHTFVDETADFDMAVKIAVNAKVSRCSVCNAMETLLVHQDIAAEFLPKLVAAMTEKHVVLRGCERARAICPEMEEATEEDWSTEYGDLILSVRVVDDLTMAIAHINCYNTGHSEAIITKDILSAHRFQREVDAAAVYVNASTRFTDGFEFGFGAEIGISTQKLHARGPMGLMALTSTKYLIYGEGQIRE